MGDYKKITPKEAKEMIEGPVPHIVLDVRTKDEYEQGHITQAQLLSLDELEQKIEENVTDKNQRILVYCRSGLRSKYASELLLKKGYQEVYDFGGILDWPYEILK